VSGAADSRELASRTTAIKMNFTHAGIDVLRRQDNWTESNCNMAHRRT
jgi:hypothetical protein